MLKVHVIGVQALIMGFEPYHICMQYSLKYQFDDDLKLEYYPHFFQNHFVFCSGVPEAQVGEFHHFDKLSFGAVQHAGVGEFDWRDRVDRILRAAGWAQDFDVCRNFLFLQKESSQPEKNKAKQKEKKKQWSQYIRHVTQQQ